jgi:fatty acid desaturase
MVIFCGHFPDGAEKLTRESFENETRGEWYLRQMLGSANFNAGPVIAFMSGNLCYQIEHHMFPDLPSNRYAEIGVRVRAICEKYDLPYTTGPLLRQYWQSFWTILKLAVPDSWLPAPPTMRPRPIPNRNSLNGSRGRSTASATDCAARSRAAPPRLPNVAATRSAARRPAPA